VLDVNDHDPQITLSTLTSSSDCHVTESADPGTFVALVSVSDSDLGDNARTRCQLEPAGSHFELVELQRSAKYKLVTGTAALDRETRAEYQLRVTCSDAGQPARSAVTSVVVSVTDVNDNSPHFRFRSDDAGGEYHFTVTENNVIGQSVGHVTAEDRDVGENARLGYVITGDLVSTVNFRVDAESGTLRAVAVLDHETAPRDGFRFQVRPAQ